MSDNAEINFDASANLRKWPSLNNERVNASLGARPYLIIDGTLDECIRKFMAMPVSQHHLYEIHTVCWPRKMRHWLRESFAPKSSKCRGKNVEGTKEAQCGV